MSSTLITIEDLDRWGACGRHHEYRDEILHRWLNGRPGLTALEVARLRQAPCVDRLWVLLRSEVIGEELCREAADVYADRAVRRHALPHPVTREWARRWLSGEDRSKAAAWAAGDAAWAAWAAARAAWAAAGDAAWAAGDAAWAAGDAAWDAGGAAGAAAWDAAGDAAWDAAGDAWQLAWLRKRLEANDE